MELLRRTERTRDGVSLDVVCLAPPLSAEMQTRIDAISPVKEPWKTAWWLRMRGALTAECRDRFIVGLVDGKSVARMWYTVSGDFATFGAVFTAEPWRGRGISSKLLRATLEMLDFEEGLRATYLGVSKPVPRAMYTKAGWFPYNDGPGTCIMRRFRRGVEVPDFDREYFAGVAPYHVRLGRRGDLPRLEALYNLMLPEAAFERNPVHGIHRGVAVECQIDAMFNECDSGSALLNVLEDSKGRLLGVAFARRDAASAERDSTELEWHTFVAPGAKDGVALLLQHSAPTLR